MPGISHEAPLELLRRNPPLAMALLDGLGVAVPAGATATITSADETASVPAELRADAVILLTGRTGQLAVVVEVQLRYDLDKLYTWPAYIILARLAHRCPAVLLVICADAATARRCRSPIAVGHPGFQLKPLVIDSATMPDPAGPGKGQTGPELTVLAVLTGALDLNQDSVRRQVLASLAGLDEDRRKIYTVFILTAASPQAQDALEELMTTTEFHHPFVDRLLAEGEAKGLAEGEAKGLAEGEAKGEAKGQAKGEAQMILRILAARGLQPPAAIRERVLACTDTSQLETWGDRAATANTIEDVFGD
jgi:hypothetical protein